MSKNDEIIINPVWSRFCTVQIESWAEWLASIHVNSYLETAERFIGLNPFWVPTSEDRTPLFDNLMVNDEFLESLSDAGLLVWANSTFRDFVTALRPYGRAVKEIDYVVSFSTPILLGFPEFINLFVLRPSWTCDLVDATFEHP